MRFPAGSLTPAPLQTPESHISLTSSPAGIAIRVPDVAAAREELEAKGVEFRGDILHTSVCDMTFFQDPDGNELILHRRFAPFADGRLP